MKTIILSACLLLLSCNAHKESKVTTINFSEEENCDIFSNESMELAGFTPLDSIGSPIVSSDSKMVESDGYYYFFDNSKMVVHRFDRSGKFLNSIGTRGRGPTEYSAVEDFCIDPANGNIEFLSLMAQQLYIYNNDGAFISTFKIQGYPYSFTKFDDGSYLFCKGQVADENVKIGNAQLYTIDKAGVVKERYLPIEKNNAFQTPMRDESIQVSNGNVFFKAWFTGDVYEITKSGPRHVTTIDFKDRAYDKTILEKSTDAFMEFLTAVNPYNIGRYLENENYIYIYVTDANYQKFYHLLHNKTSGKTKITNAIRDNSKYPAIGPAKSLSPNNELLFLIDPIVISDLRNNSDNPFNGTLEIPSISDNSNAILVNFKVK